MRDLHVTTGLFARTLRSKPEDAITEVLAALLRSETIGLKVLQALLPGRNEQPEQILTQWRGEDGSRPDLVLRWPGVGAVIIEVKFWAPLQETQRDGYRAALSPEDPPATFYFLAPAVRRKFEPKPGFISWDNVNRALAKIGEGTETERVWLQELIAAIRQEASLMHQPRQITQSELDILTSKETGPALANCLNLIDALRSSLGESGGELGGFAPNGPCAMEMTEQSLAYGFYIEPVRGVEGWAGFHIKAWHLGSRSPIGVELWRHEQQERRPTLERPPDSFDISYEDGTKTIWIPLSLSIEEPDELVKDLQRQLDHIYEHLTRR